MSQHASSPTDPQQLAASRDEIERAIRRKHSDTWKTLLKVWFFIFISTSVFSVFTWFEAVQNKQRFQVLDILVVCIPLTVIGYVLSAISYRDYTNVKRNLMDSVDLKTE
jgi:high-affinity K+ transport system ATPase subunit B